MATIKSLHQITPLIESTRPLQWPGKVFFKMDALQPSGSFKIRGIGNRCQKAVREQGCQHFISSSGGNAGMAVAYSGRALGVPVDVVVPTPTESFMIDKLEALGARVTKYGDIWNEAHAYATDLQTKSSDSVLIHPFEHNDTWDGHASIISETAEQLREMNEPKPSGVVTCVGGGGLLTGVMRGMERVGWDKVPVYACETEGAASFALATSKEEIQGSKQGELNVPSLDSITSMAKSLGALQVHFLGSSPVYRLSDFSLTLSDMRRIYI